MTTRQDLDLRQGETWAHTYIHKDSDGAAVDMTGFEARMSIKAGFQSSNEAYLSNGTDAKGGTIFLGSDGTITLSMTATQSGAIAGDLGVFLFNEPAAKVDRFETFSYDLELVDTDGVVSRVLEGRFIVQRGNTS